MPLQAVVGTDYCNRRSEKLRIISYPITFNQSKSESQDITIQVGFAMLVAKILIHAVVCRFSLFNNCATCRLRDHNPPTLHTD